MPNVDISYSASGLCFAISKLVSRYSVTTYCCDTEIVLEIGVLLFSTVELPRFQSNVILEIFRSHVYFCVGDGLDRHGASYYVNKRYNAVRPTTFLSYHFIFFEIRP